MVLLPPTYGRHWSLRYSILNGTFGLKKAERAFIIHQVHCPATCACRLHENTLKSWGGGGTTLNQNLLKAPLDRYILLLNEGGIACWLERWTRDQKVARSNPGRIEARESFLLQSQFCVLTFNRCPFHPCITAVARKRPQSFFPKVQLADYT